VAVRTGSGLSWLAGDVQGTSQIAINSDTLQVTQRRQLPFGGPRGGSVVFPGQKGFVGGTVDSSIGLTQLGVREYDPALGRFLSVDPVADQNDSQQLHGYTYADNNPITKLDPSGADWFSDYLNIITGPPPPPAAADDPPMPLVPRGQVQAPAKAPKVHNQKLREIVAEGYARDNVGKGIDRGTVADAVRYEMHTGNKIQGIWHYQKAAQVFNRLAKWLDGVKNKTIVADQADVDVADAEARDIWDALNTSDRTGNVVAEIKAKDAAGDHNFRNSIKNSNLPGVSDITGADVEPPKTVHNNPRVVSPPKFVARGISALNFLQYGADIYREGWQDATFDLFDVTGVGRQYLERLEQVNSGMYTA
jgi:RHS repeat-associated protein